MKFIVLMSQSGGCDYTIGCGKKWEIIEAGNINEAFEKVFGKISDIDESTLDDLSGWMDDHALVSGIGMDGCPDTVEIYELGKSHASTSQCEKAYNLVQKRIKKIKHNADASTKKEKERSVYFERRAPEIEIL